MNCFTLVIEDEKAQGELEVSESYYHRGNYNFSLKKYPEANFDYETYLKVSKISDNEATLFTCFKNIGYSSLLLKQYEKAIKFYNLALEKNPSEVGFYCSIAECYVHLGQLEKAA